MRFVIGSQKDHRRIAVNLSTYRTYLLLIPALNLVPFSVEVPVAFSTLLTGDTSINDSPVIFGTVELNIGDGYDEFTETNYSYHFFSANQQKVVSKFFSWTQHEFCVNRCDWRILAGNEKRIGKDCLNRGKIHHKYQFYISLLKDEDQEQFLNMNVYNQDHSGAGTNKILNWIFQGDYISWRLDQPMISNIFQVCSSLLLTVFTSWQSTVSQRMMISGVFSSSRMITTCVTAFLDDDSGSTGACTAIAELTTGDSVRVTGDSANPTVLRGDRYSGFTGFLIYDS